MTARTGENRWKVILEDGLGVELDTPYGHPHRMERKGVFQVEMLLSPINERIQIYRYQTDDFVAMTAELRTLAEANGYGKIWVKAPAKDQHLLEEAGFRREAAIPRYFSGDDAVSMALFVKPEREERPTGAEEDEIQEKSLAGKVLGSGAPMLPEGYRTALFTEADAEELAQLYDEVFPTYPYPITDPQYLRETAESHVIYRLVRNGEGKLVAAASAECAPQYRNAEMTDFASLPSERGKGLAQFLLLHLEKDARERFGTLCFYTIARALSFGMLRTFHKCGYELTGTLVNNCNIAGKFESMHVLVRP